ncbi:MAG TPA: sigma-54 dependent transcriptional regulator [Nitrospira sp.]|nr:sigma-54 dependent transcriptional regulator [Nitrospira sp.]
MAGSHIPEAPASPFSDPILDARMEAIRQLADGLSDRVAVMDRQFNVLYVNHENRSLETPGLSHPRQFKCYQAFAHRTDPCDVCPAAEVFDASSSEIVSCADAQSTTACGMQRAFPLRAQNGRVTSMVVVFEKSAPARALPDMPVPEEAALPMVREQLEELIGRSQVMQQLFDMISLVADSAATVLIQGESGTGKELVAKTVHRLSNRRGKPFVVVDCGSLPETLLESELFGHVKGAFTGAVANKRGLFEEADGGTIFLDEIADTSSTFQAKLLRVLQEGEVKRVGGNHPIKIDARVISATNKDLSELVKAKQFRQDLYYRLAVLPLYLPPLRERREDIALLVERFLLQSCARHRQPMRHVSKEALRVLTEASWPGNVRQLKHYLERAVVTTSGPALPCEDMMPMKVESPVSDLRSISRDARKQAERARIVQALADTQGNRVKAAKHLKISRASLYTKIRNYCIE